MTSGRNVSEIDKFLSWFNQLKIYKYKIFIAGNHDLLFESQEK